MDQLCLELGIPRKHIRATKHANQYTVLVHRAWLAGLLLPTATDAASPSAAAPSSSAADTAQPQTNPSQRAFPAFRTLQSLRTEADEWPADENWQTVHLTIHPKHSHRVIPLAPWTATTAAVDQPLGFSGLLQSISVANHRHLWRAAYKRYAASRPKSTPHGSSQQHEAAAAGSLSHLLAPYETVMREALGRMYARPIVQLLPNAAGHVEVVPAPSASHQGDAHPNLYGAHAIVETATAFHVVHSDRIGTTLLDCIAYSPAILARSHNKPLFLIYQLLQLTHSLHQAGLFVGNLELADCHVTENLWLRVRAPSEANLLLLLAADGGDGGTDWPATDADDSMAATADDALQSTATANTTTSATAVASPSPPRYSIADYCEMWCQGHLSNFDYLTILNNLSGRRIGAPGSHHIMPWVSDLAGRNGANWRDLKKSKYRLNKGDAQLDQMFAGPGAAANGVTPHHVSDVLSEITFFVYMARRTPKAVLCRHVRPIWVPAEYPVSIQRLQQWTPDECIPEFFTEPAVFKSVHEDLADLEVPAWATCPEDFVAKHREALESQHVSERLHHWIDLNFGYKLSGVAAVKAKNVCLSLVNGHKTLSERGVVQLFGSAHPARRQPSAWTEKQPPRIYSLAESQRRRLTRSSEDLRQEQQQQQHHHHHHHNHQQQQPNETEAQPAQQSHRHIAKPSPRVFQSPNAARLRSPSTSSAGSRRESSMERSTSYHMPPVQRSQHQIQLPRDYNPVAALTAVEQTEQFLCKIFHRQTTTAASLPAASDTSATVAHPPHAGDVKLPHSTDLLPSATNCCCSDSALETSFTNRLFSETFDELFLHSKDSKRLRNVQQHNTQLRRHTDRRRRDFRQRWADQRATDLQVLGCLVVELFAADKLRPLGALTGRLDFEARRTACLAVLRHHPDALPRCVRYPVQLLLQQSSSEPITQCGLPPPTAQQFLQPLLAHALFPFPLHYAKVYTLLGGLAAFDETLRDLGHRTLVECDGSDCGRFAGVEHARHALRRRIAECKVMSCAAQIERLLEPVGLEQFAAMELVLPHIVDLLRSDETAILTAWHLFDSVALALGPARTLEHLLQPVLRLFDAAEDRAADDGVRTAAAGLGATGADGGGTAATAGTTTSMGTTAGPVHRSRKTGKLYHHSFLLILIVRFGLAKFLAHFVAPLIEAVGGRKEMTADRGSGHWHAQPPQQNNTGRSPANFHFDDDGSFDLPSAVPPSVQHHHDAVDVSSVGHGAPRGSSLDTEEEMFVFDDDSTAAGSTKNASNGTNDDDYDASSAILKIIDQLDPTLEGSMLDLRLNATLAEECTETTPLVEYCEFGATTAVSNGSLDLGNTLRSPTIPIPTFRRSTELSTIDCEIGSKQSMDSAEFLDRCVVGTPQPHKQPVQANVASESATLSSATHSARSRSRRQSTAAAVDMDASHRHCIADTSAQSLLWLAHRLGPVLTARHLTRNLLKMLTLCYVGQENLLPAAGSSASADPSATANLNTFSISDGRVVGDAAATRVLDCLAAVSALFGDQFVLRQYLPHIAEIVAQCRRRCTASLEGGLIGSVQLLKFLVPCLSDRTIMEQLPDALLAAIVHPLIRLLGSGRFVMPSGFLARSVLARKLLDAVYVLAVRIGPEMTKDHLCVPALQRFFLIFDKAYGGGGGANDPAIAPANNAIAGSPSASSDDSFVMHGSPVPHSRPPKLHSTIVTGTPQLAPQNATGRAASSPLTLRRAQAHEEICDVFEPSLAHCAYVTFLHYLGEHAMTQCVKNLPLILSLCHTYEQPAAAAAAAVSAAAATAASTADRTEPVQHVLQSADTVDHGSNSFGTMVIGNRLDIAEADAFAAATVTGPGDIGAEQLLDACTYKYDQINSARHLRGNWLAYWEHECGRPDADGPFNLKQIKLQTFAGHTNSVKALLCLDNENSFMSASKDKTVKLWSLRSEGDGSRVSACQFTYAAHRKSVHSLAFLDAMRLAVSCDAGVHMWDPFVGTLVGQLDSHRLTPVSVVRAMPAPSALVLAGTAEATVRTIDARTMTYVTEWRLLGGAGGSGSGSVRCVAVAPSGAWLACGLSSGQLVVLDGRTGMVMASWRATDGELLQLLAPNDGQVVSTSLDSCVCVWSSADGALLFQMKNPPEPAHCMLSTSTSSAGSGQELLFGTPSNRIGVYAQIARDAGHSITKLRAETFKGVLTSMALLPLNRMLLVGADSGLISLIC